MRPPLTLQERLDLLPLPTCTSPRAKVAYVVGLAVIVVVCQALACALVWGMVVLHHAVAAHLEARTLPQERTVVLWCGRLWYLVSHADEVWLESLSPNGRGGPQRAALVPLPTHPWEPVSLVPDGPRLWILSRRFVAFHDGTLHVLGVERPLESRRNCVLPFVHRGLPAAVHEHGHIWGLSFYLWGRWHLASTSADGATLAASDGHAIHLFNSRKGNLRTRRWGHEPWHTVVRGAAPAQPLLLDGTLTLFSRGPSGLLAHRWRGAHWQSVPLDGVPYGHVVPQVAGGLSTVAIDWEQLAAMTRTDVNADGRVRAATIIRQGLQVPLAYTLGSLMCLFLELVVVPLIGCALLDLLIRRCCLRTASWHEIPPASLTRRALAAYIDLSLVLGPVIAVLFSTTRTLQPPAPLWLHASWMWAVAAFLLLTWAEGRSGRTAGKRLLGLRTLGTDLRPCGFGRALVRIAGAVSSPWLFAFTDDGQHLGDRLARTLVLRG